MKQSLTADHRKNLDELISKTEKRTQTQIVLAVIERSDSYIELPWKAFAFGASITGILVVIFNFLMNTWHSQIPTWIGITLTLAGGALGALLAAFIPKFAKLFLSRDRAEVEVEQYAQSLFLEREIFATKNRTGILFMISLFERKIVILPDTGLHKQLPEQTLKTIIATMAPHLKRRNIDQALAAGLEKLSQMLGESVKGSSENELQDTIIEEKGV